MQNSRGNGPRLQTIHAGEHASLFWSRQFSGPCHRALARVLLPGHVAAEAQKPGQQHLPLPCKGKQLQASKLVRMLALRWCHRRRLWTLLIPTICIQVVPCRGK